MGSSESITGERLVLSFESKEVNEESKMRYYCHSLSKINQSGKVVNTYVETVCNCLGCDLPPWYLSG